MKLPFSFISILPATFQIWTPDDQETAADKFNKSIIKVQQHTNYNTKIRSMEKEQRGYASQGGEYPELLLFDDSSINHYQPLESRQ